MARPPGHGEECRRAPLFVLRPCLPLFAGTDAATAYCENINSPTELEKAAAVFLSVPQYKDAREQALQCMDKAKKIRDDLYNDAVKAMQEAGEESAKWKEAKKLLAEKELDSYPDIKQLRTKAAERYEKYLAAEKEQARCKAEAAAAKKKRNTILGAVAAAVAVAVFLLVTKAIIPASNYRKAENLRANGRYEEAVAAFMNAGSYSDAETQITETRYQQGKTLLAAKNYNGAWSIFKFIRGYKDVDNLIANDQNLAAAARDAKYAVGNYVTFGTYPQTRGGDDSTPIEWLVLARDGNKALLISRYGLDAQPYNEKWTNVTWEKCTLRTWLNGTFMNKAFTANEQTGILLTNVDNSSSQGYSGWSTSGGNNTQDKIFLLSYAEANRYLDVTYGDHKNMKSRVAPTAYVKKQTAYTSYIDKTADGDVAEWWWLRSPGNYQDIAAFVRCDGSLDNDLVGDDIACVRPALWINLESGIF